MKAAQRVCQHVKRGICETCANPTAAPKSEHRHYRTAFGAALIGAFYEAGIKPPNRPRRRYRRNKQSNRPAN